MSSHRQSRRRFLRTNLLGAAALGLPDGFSGRSRSRLAAAAESGGETLSNGIRLPTPWPPRHKHSFEPHAPPYLASPPAPETSPERRRRDGPGGESITSVADLLRRMRSAPQPSGK